MNVQPRLLQRRKFTYGSIPLGVNNLGRKKQHPINWITILLFAGSFFLLLLLIAYQFPGQAGTHNMRLEVEEDLSFHQDSNERHIRIEASNLYDAGHQLGLRTALRIRQFLALDTTVTVIDFAKTPTGRATLEALKKDNSELYPELVRHLQGIADGARIDADLIWVCNLYPELVGNLPGHTVAHELQVQHCADIYSYDNKGNALQGHTEDWSPPESGYLWSMVEFIPTEDADFAQCTGLSYPGTFVGYGPAWNEHGIYHTQNTLLSGTNRADGGVACTFAQRDALCGGVGSKSIEEYIAKIHPAEWCSGSNLNVVDYTENKMASVENWMHTIDVHWVPQMGNYSHFNWYQHNKGGMKIDEAATRIENILRVERVWDQPPPRTYEQMVEEIGDESDLGDDFRGHRVRIHRYNTLATFIVDRARGTLEIWETESPTSGPPRWTYMLGKNQEPTASGDHGNGAYDFPLLNLLYCIAASIVVF